eukprot:gene2054-8447_t
MPTAGAAADGDADDACDRGCCGRCCVLLLRRASREGESVEEAARKRVVLPVAAGMVVIMLVFSVQNMLP